MKSRAFWMLGLALVLAGTAVFLARGWIENQPIRTAVAAPKATRIVVAGRRLDFGAIIRKEHLRVIAWPSEAVPVGAFTSIGLLVREKDHRVALRRIEANEPVLKSKVSGFGGRASLSATIAKEMRAATIRVNDVDGVAGFILPGDRVDILITRHPITGGKVKRGRSNRNIITDILLQNVKVLAVDQEADESKNKPTVARAVTLEVTPEQVQILVLAQQVGKLSLALRNVSNANPTKTKTVTMSDLRNTADGASAGPTDNAKSSRTPVKIFRGMNISEYDVPTKRRTPKTRTRSIPITRSNPINGSTPAKSARPQPAAGAVLPFAVDEAGEVAANETTSGAASESD